VSVQQRHIFLVFSGTVCNPGQNAARRHRAGQRKNRQVNQKAWTRFSLLGRATLSFTLPVPASVIYQPSEVVVYAPRFRQQHRLTNITKPQYRSITGFANLPTV
jgi:hypothetical protein